MKLQQLRYILEVYRQNLNVSAAAESLFTSQPGISKQIRLLEEELGVPIFIRQGRKMAAVTEPGRLILEIAERILRETQNIKKIGNTFARTDTGLLNIAGSSMPITHYLPQVIDSFSRRHPQVDISVQNMPPDDVTQALLSAKIDLAVLAQDVENHADLCYLPCGYWREVLIMPFNHPLADAQQITLAQLAQCVLLVHESAKSTKSPMINAFQAASLPLPRIALSTDDEYLIQKYVAEGFGVGIVSAAAVEHLANPPFLIWQIDHLFSRLPLYVVLPRERYLRDFVYDFISIFAPQLNQHIVNQLLYQPPEEDFSI